jgi:hypothetical protein
LDLARASFIKIKFPLEVKGSHDFVTAAFTILEKRIYNLEAFVNLASLIV